MAKWLDNVLGTISDAVGVSKDEGYQTPLELNGIAMRIAMRPYMYFKRTYPYATCGDAGFLRTNDAYVAASGWKPSTYVVENTVIDGEFEKIASEFDID